MLSRIFNNFLCYLPLSKANCKSSTSHFLPLKMPFLKECGWCHLSYFSTFLFIYIYSYAWKFDNTIYLLFHSNKIIIVVFKNDVFIFFESLYNLTMQCLNFVESLCCFRVMFASALPKLCATFYLFIYSSVEIHFLLLNHYQVYFTTYIQTGIFR